jgi:SAM-dependent methyltransferase
MESVLVPLLRCPTCSSRFTVSTGDLGAGTLLCGAVALVSRSRTESRGSCARPKIGRLAERRQASAMSGPISTTGAPRARPISTTISRTSILNASLVLDAGCGMGRHARHVARLARHVVAVDFSAAIDQAARNGGSREEAPARGFVVTFDKETAAVGVDVWLNQLDARQGEL